MGDKELRSRDSIIFARVNTETNVRRWVARACAHARASLGGVHSFGRQRISFSSADVFESKVFPLGVGSTIVKVK